MESLTFTATVYQFAKISLSLKKKKKSLSLYALMVLFLLALQKIALGRQSNVTLQCMSMLVLAEEC